MLKSFQINGYKKFADIKFDNLSRVNILLGNNNVGKTTVLEAIYSLASGTDISGVISNSIRSSWKSANLYEFMDALLNIFHSTERDYWFLYFAGEFEKIDTQVFKHFFKPEKIFADLEPSLLSHNIPKDLTRTDEVKYLGAWAVAGVDDNKVLNATNIPYPFSTINMKKLNKDHEDGNSVYPVRFVDFLAHRDKEENFKIYSHLKRGRRGKLVEEFITDLSRTFPDITGIDCLPYPDGEMGPISFLTKNGLLPISSFGEGLQRWFHLLGGMVVYQNAIHCMEEIDATFHPNAQKELGVNLVNSSIKYNNQLFLTSHSLEFVDNLLEGLYGSKQELESDCVRIITLRNDEKTNQVKVRVLTGEEAYKSREKYRMELR